jgi:uncharacterized protein YerC
MKTVTRVYDDLCAVDEVRRLAQIVDAEVNSNLEWQT